MGAHQRFQAAGVFSAPLRGDGSVIVAAGENRPSNAGQLVGHGDDNDVLRRLGIECIEPGSDRGFESRRPRAEIPESDARVHP